MKLLEAQNLLATRLYDWSLRDLLREMENGCPFLSLVGLNNRYVTAFVAWIKAMPANQRKVLAEGLIRRAHENAAALRGESLSKQAMDQLNLEVFTQVKVREHELPPLVIPEEGAFEPVAPDKCLDLLVSSLSPVLGKPIRRKSGVRTTRKINDWKLITEFTFYRRDQSLHFEHQFVRKDGIRWIGHGGPFPRNLFWLYGLCNTSVDVLCQADSEPMAKAMAKLAEHFVVQADPLFAGLEMD